LDTLNRQEQGMEVDNSDEEFEMFNNEDTDEETTEDEDDVGDKATTTTTTPGSKGAKSSSSGKQAEADKYLAPLEVEAQIKLLWQNHQEFLNFIWTRGIHKTNNSTASNSLSIDIKTYPGWSIFFLKTVIVPPNKFRPASIVGEQLSEHPQNLHLKKILELNSTIRLMQLKSNQQSLFTLPSTPSSSSSSSSSFLPPSTPTTAAVNDFQLSKLITAWIDLQNAINCYMDSSKDQNAGNPEFDLVGIKQILERKEGLFRRHMMGKRVNFCCRSVISPDPYLGTNEIGIPVRFAKELHYPTPVNQFNFKYLKGLVERGPEQYPGKK
jgi:DNA-directed RNA polymerase I subunit RPA1